MDRPSTLLTGLAPLLLLAGCQSSSSAHEAIEAHCWHQRFARHARTESSSIELDWTSCDGTSRPDRIRLPYFRVRAEHPSEHTLVLFHGDPGGKEVWSKFVLGVEGSTSPISDCFDVLAIDLPGHGLSTYCRPISDAVEVAELMVAALEKLRKQEVLRGGVTLVGHSWGGEVALHTAANPCGKISRLVLIDAVGFPRLRAEIQPSEENTVGWFVGGILGRLFDVPESFVQAGLEELYSPSNQALLEAEHVPALYQAFLNHRRNDSVSRAIALRDVYRTSPASTVSAISRISIPTLLVWGGEDPAWTVQTQALAYQHLLEESTLAVLRNCGHLPPEERPELLASVVSAWIAEDRVCSDAAKGLMSPTSPSLLPEPPSQANEP